MSKLLPIIAHALHLFYPHSCTACGHDVLDKDALLCMKCIHQLPHTHFAAQENNPVEKIFFGRLSLTAAHSEFYFSKASIMQQLIHQLKYKGNTEIGFHLGEWLGQSLLASHRFNGLDAILPLPLYPDKERKRGYNQAAVICEGISAVRRVPVLKNKVIRQRHTDTQTKKHRAERWQNVDGSFIVLDKPALAGKNVLLVDDVITTGASLEACGAALMAVPNLTLSIATLAIASK